MKRNIRKPVIVRTRDLEYKGYLSSSSTKEEKKEIVLDQPVIIYTDEDGTTKDFCWGIQIILFGDDIRSITVLEE